MTTQNVGSQVRRTISSLGKLALIVFGAISLLAPLRIGAAQNAPAGPQSAAAPSDPPSPPAGPSQAKARPNLAGTWKLNQDQSDNPQRKMQESGGFGGGMGGRRGRRGGRRGMMNGLSQLAIDQSGSKVKVTNVDGRVIAQYPGADNSSADSPSVQWQGAQLVATAPGRRGGSTTRTFELSPDGKQLYVITRIDSPRLQQPVTIRLVYDSAKSSE